MRRKQQMHGDGGFSASEVISRGKMKTLLLGQFVHRIFITTCFVSSVMVTAAGQSIISNSGFESGTTPWQFFSDGSATFATRAAGGSQAGHVVIAVAGSNVQLYQTGFALEANTDYLLTFRAFSNTGRDLAMSMRKHTSPYGSFGLDNHIVDLTTAWNTYSVEFTTTGFSGTTTDVRFLFWFASFGASGDEYFFDDVIIRRQDSSAAGPVIANHPSNQTTVVGQTAAFSVTATGASPLSYQWQQDSVNIVGATNESYLTTPANVSENGSLFRCIVSNSSGSVTSRPAILSVTPAPQVDTRGRVRIVNNTVVADNGTLLRGDHLRMTTENLPRLQDSTWYQAVALRYHFNTVRLLCYRNPINIPGYTCEPVTQCMPVLNLLPLLDIAVEQTRRAGLYAIIDYHPVNGYDEAEAIAWWNVVAPRYQHLPHVLFDITNEPSGCCAVPPNLAAYEQRMYSLLRPLAPNTHLIMWSLPTGSNTFFNVVRSTTGINYSNASVGVHSYGTDWNAVSVLRQTHPVFMTEAQICEGTIVQCQNSAPAYVSAATGFENSGLSWILLKAISVGIGYPDNMTSVNPVPWPIDPYFTSQAVTSTQEVPLTFSLAQNYPNPFNPTTEVTFSLIEGGLTTLKVYNVMGEEIATLVNEKLGAGVYVSQFDAGTFSSGVYLYRLVIAGKFVAVRKMLFIK